MTRAAVVLVAWLAGAAGVRGEEGMPVLVDFSSGDVVARWAAVDDVVMGGVSRSRLEPGEGAAVFSGLLSLERGGGFASVRGPVADTDFSACAGIELRVRGDGRTYRLRLHDTRRFDGVAWQARFPTRPDEWETLMVPFTAFEASFRGRAVPGAPPLATGRILQAGFMIAERQAGPFRLEIAWARGSGCGG